MSNVSPSANNFRHSKDLKCILTVHIGAKRQYCVRVVFALFWILMFVCPVDAINVFYTFYHNLQTYWLWIHCLCYWQKPSIVIRMVIVWTCYTCDWFIRRIHPNITKLIVWKNLVGYRIVAPKSVLFHSLYCLIFFLWASYVRI